MDDQDETNDEFDAEAVVPGSSVFGGDVPSASGGSVFANDDDESTDAGDGTDDDLTRIELGSDYPAEERSGTESVFANPTASIDDDPWAASDEPEPAFAAPEDASDPVDTGTNDNATSDVHDVVDVTDPVIEIEDAAPGAAVPLDVIEPERDDLDAWADLPQTEVEAEAEPIRIEVEEDQFFTFDDQAPEPESNFVSADSGGRDMQSAVITGVGLLALAGVALAVSNLAALALITIFVMLSAGELFNALRLGGYQPITLLGLAASVAMPIAVYTRGPQAAALVLGLTVLFGLLWYLAGISSDLPVMNLGVTVLGVAYVGLLGSFGAAMLEIAERTGNDSEGQGLLLAAIVVTIGYDVGAFFAGRSFGQTPLTAVSPNKTVEGLVGGAFASLVAAVVFFGLLKIGEPWDSQGSFPNAVVLGLIGAVLAPLGDLAESLIKRDLGIKDMGSVLPGHGGFLDRFDALLFVLPGVYFLAEAVFYT